MSKPIVGKILDPDLNPTRDAIHLPTLPVYAGQTLSPGQKIKVFREGPGPTGLATGRLIAVGVNRMADGIGVVDPYIDKEVIEGQLFTCHLKPNSVAKLWHEWRHPQIDAM